MGQSAGGLHTLLAGTTAPERTPPTCPADWGGFASQIARQEIARFLAEHLPAT